MEKSVAISFHALVDLVGRRKSSGITKKQKETRDIFGLYSNLLVYIQRHANTKEYSGRKMAMRNCVVSS